MNDRQDTHIYAPTKRQPKLRVRKPITLRIPRLHPSTSSSLLSIHSALVNPNTPPPRRAGRGAPTLTNGLTRRPDDNPHPPSRPRIDTHKQYTASPPSPDHPGGNALTRCLRLASKDPTYPSAKKKKNFKQKNPPRRNQSPPPIMSSLRFF